MHAHLSPLEKIQTELGLYEHPLFHFSAETVSQGVQVTISVKVEPVCDPYRFLISHRDLADPQYGWRFQNLLYNYIHDYMVEAFTQTPQHR
jgi:hypothetical protein